MVYECGGFVVSEVNRDMLGSGVSPLEPSIITNVNGMPFDESVAQHMAAVLSNETGRHYRAIPWQEGFVIEPFSASLLSRPATEQAFGDVYLRPAIRSQLLPLLFALLFFLAARSMEPIMLLFGLDHLRVLLYELLGKTFAWEPVMLLLGRLAFCHWAIGPVSYPLRLVQSDLFHWSQGRGSDLWHDRQGSDPH